MDLPEDLPESKFVRTTENVRILHHVSHRIRPCHIACFGGEKSSAGMPDEGEKRENVPLEWMNELKKEEYNVQEACSVDWFVSLLVCKEVLLTGLCERKILLKIYDRLR